MIENVSEWQNAEVPQHLTEELAKKIHAEALLLRNELLEQESVRLGIKLSLDDPEAQYVIQLAADIKILENNITEA